MNRLPIDDVLPQLRDALRVSRAVVLSAEPGAGKTTRVPLALLEEEWLKRSRLIMLEPRRLAAQRAAEFMAAQIGEKAGETVGYRIRGDTRVSPSTRIEVVTEGVLTRILHQDPGLAGVALLIFDEFHERSIHADLGLALALDVQAHIREDLRLLVMSATLDGLALSRVLGDAPLIQGSGRLFPVATRYRLFRREGELEPAVAETILRALETETGDMLVFLPGQREIRRVEELLQDADLPPQAVVHMLYSEASREQQMSALAPAPPGVQKVILSTSIAETSITIDGVRVVVDAGLSRGPRFDPRRGMSGLTTGPVSQAGADQRRGRAGRQKPGVCYRMWTEDEQKNLARFPTPEILSTDLGPLALDLARWGASETEGLRFIDPPPASHLSQARSLLRHLGALDDQGRITAHGRAMAELPVHPRLAHMVISGQEMGLGAMACDIAALLEEADLLQGRTRKDIDFSLRWHALQSGADADRRVLERVTAEARRLRGLIGVQKSNGDEGKLGMLLALAYPERVARRRSEGSGRYQMVNGTGALLPGASLLSREEFLAIADVDGAGTEVRVYLAAPIQRRELQEQFAGHILTEEVTFWSTVEEAVVSRRAQKLGAVIIEEQSFQPQEETLRAAMLEGVRLMGLHCLPWTKESNAVRARSEWLRLQNLVPTEWPDLSDEHLLNTLPEWLGPFVNGMGRRTHLANLDMTAVLLARFSFDQRRELDRLAPASLTVPTGSRIRLDYSAGVSPVLAVRLQEMFGQTDTPTIAGGNVGVLVHLLSPAGRPLAVTQDLRSFWMNAYPEVRKQMRGRYPRHAWPEDPMHASPTRRARPRR